MCLRTRRLFPCAFESNCLALDGRSGAFLRQGLVGKSPDYL